jgi:hypothetical protein
MFYRFVARYGAWSLTGILVLSDLPKSLSTSESRKLTAIDIEKTPLIKHGAQVVSVVPISDDRSGGIALYLSFSDQSRFMIRPAPVSRDEDDDEREAEDQAIADWEMYTPIGRYLRVGPGQKWSYLASSKEE